MRRSFLLLVNAQSADGIVTRSAGGGGDAAGCGRDDAIAARRQGCASADIGAGSRDRIAAGGDQRQRCANDAIEFHGDGEGFRYAGGCSAPGGVGTSAVARESAIDRKYGHRRDVDFCDRVRRERKGAAREGKANDE